MSYLISFSTDDLSPNESYVSESVFRPGVQVGDEEVKSRVRSNDGKMLPDLNQEYVEEDESFFVPPSYLQYTYGTYHLRRNSAKDFEEGDNDFEEDDDNEKCASEVVDIKVEPNPDVSYETDQVYGFVEELKQWVYDRVLASGYVIVTGCSISKRKGSYAKKLRYG